MFTLALATVLGYQQNTITFKSNFEPLGKVVERLSAETHIPMAAFGDLKGYPVYVNVKDVSVKDLLDRLATVSGAEWQNKDNSFYLIASQSLRNDQAKAGDPDLISAIEATINQPAPKKKTEAEMEAVIKNAEKDPKQAMKIMGEIFGQMFQADEGTMELLKVIGSKDLSTIVEGRRVVLSNNPTQMQVLMPAKAVNAIKTYLKKLAAATPKKENKENNGFDFGSIFGGGQGLKNPELVNQIQTIQTVFQINQRSVLNVEMSAFTSDGKGVYRRTVQIPIVNPEAVRPAAKGETKLDVAPVARDYAQAIEDGKRIDPFMNMLMTAQTGMAGAMSMFMGEEGLFGQETPAPKAISPAMQKLMTEPDKNEPLSYLLGPLLDVEAAKGKNVIALPSDDVIHTLATQLVQQESTVEGILDKIDRTITEEISQDGTWEVMQASSPLELRSAFCKRDALAALIKSGLSKGYVNLDDCSRFASIQDSSRGSELLALPLITAVFHTSDLGSATALTGLGFDALKLYATLTDFQRQSLAAKRPVPLASLTMPQRTILARMIYNGAMPPLKNVEGLDKMFGGDGEEGEGNGIEGMGGMMSIGMAVAGPMMAAMGFGDVEMESERTVLLPEGIPVVGAIKLNTISMDGVMAIDKATGNGMITMPELLSVMNSNIPGISNMKREFNEFKLAKQTTYMLHFQLGKNAVYFTSLYDVSVDTSKTYTRDQLPEKIRDRMKPQDFGNIGKDTTAVPPPVIPPTR